MRKNGNAQEATGRLSGRVWIGMAAGCWAAAACVKPAAAGKLAASIEGQEVRVTLDEKLLTSYKFAPKQKYPYFYPVNGPKTGRSVTTESSQPYPHHHSLFLACDRVNGANYWQDVNARGQIVSQGPRLVTSEPSKIEIADVCLWRQPGKDPVLRDERRFVITTAGDHVRLIDCYFKLIPLTDVRITKTNHAFFSFRARPEISVKGGGNLMNSRGQKSEKPTFGQKADWCSVWGDSGGGSEGIAILDHPDNPWYPCTWFTRDYGFVSPTPMNFLEKPMELPKGQALKLQYRVVVYGGSPREANLDGRFARWAEAKTNK